MKSAAEAPVSPRIVRVAALSSIAFLAAFTSLMALAMSAYPGGNWRDSAAPGFEFFVNYWCDLMAAQAHNGEANGASAAFSKSAFGAMALALAGFWWTSAAVIESPRIGRWGIRLGGAASVCVLAIAISEYHPRNVLHSTLTLTGGALGSVATVLVLWGSLRSGRSAFLRHLLGAATFLLAGANIVLYAVVVLWSYENSAALPVVQKLVTLTLVGWVGLTAIDALRLSATER